MKKNDLSKLNDYLRKSSSETVYLTLAEIEALIKNKLPIKAYNSSRWWANDSRFSKAQTWLSARYEVIDAKAIPYRKGVCFKKIKKSKLKFLVYNKIISFLFTFVIVPLILTSICTVIINEINKESKLHNLISSINSMYENHYYEDILDDINCLYQMLNVNKDYEILCWVSNIKANVLIDNAEKSNFNDELIEYTISTCQLGLLNAEKLNSNYYRMLFLYNIGLLYSNSYSKTLDMQYADEAILHLNLADEIYGCMSPHDSILIYEQYLTTEELRILGLEIQIKKLQTDVHLAYINHVSLYNIYDAASAVNTIIEDPHFSGLLASLDKALTLDLLYVIELNKQGADISTEHENLYLQITTNYIEGGILLYIIEKKYDIDSNKNGEIDFIASETLGNTFDTCFENINTATEYQLYEVLEANYFAISRIYYIIYLYENNENALRMFNTYFDLWLQFSDNDLAIYYFDKYFSSIQTGELLQSYIYQMENHISTFTFKDNPSLYSYMKLDIGRHYIFLLEEQMSQSYPKEDLIYSYNKSISCINACQVYFNKNSNPTICNYIKYLLDELKTLNSNFEDYK